MAKITQVIKRSGAVVPFTPERITNAIYRAAVAVGGRDRSIAEGLSAQVIQILEESCPEGHTPTIEEIQDVVEKVLIENGHARVAKAYILYRDERARRRRERADAAMTPSANIPWAKIYRVLDWSVDHKVHSTQSYGERLKNGELPQLIHEAELAYSEDVENAAELIAARRSEVRMVIISGPSSSGKTTTTIKIGQRLERFGLRLVTLNVDHYFFDLEFHPKDEFGDFDFETPQALDLALIRDHLSRLVAGKEVQIPFYDFKTGKRGPSATTMQLKENEILLIDSLHGLFPGMTGEVPNEQKFKLYLEPLLQMKLTNGEYIRWTDIRLLRRMLRDAAHRAYDPTRTLEHWHYVRSSELRNIIPNVNSADYIVNSAMPFELSIYKPKIADQVQGWLRKYENDPLREDAYTRALRIARIFSEIDALPDDSVVPDDSVIREFIGGSIYKY